MPNRRLAINSLSCAFLLSVLWLLRAGGSTAAAQQRPDLSGTWTADKAAPASLPAAPSPLFGAHFELRQKGDELTIVRPVRDLVVTARYVVGGPEARNTVPGPLCHGDAQAIETTAWEGEALALTLTGSVPPGGGEPMKANVKRVFRLQSPDTLVVEGTTAQGGKPTQVGTVYKRSGEPIKATSALPAVAKAPAAIAQAAWIAGVWIGTAGQTTVEERWTPVAGGTMIGVSRVLRGDRMTAFEFLCIAERDGSLLYSAMPNGRFPATHFMATAVTAGGITFENPQHDYPKIVRYAKKADGTLETTISGEGGQRPQSVVLKKQE
jgi:hypothetical protein